VTRDRFLQDLRIGDEDVIAHQLYRLAEGACELRPAVPVRLAHAVLDADDRVACSKVSEIGGELRGGEAALLAGELIAAVTKELRARHVQPQVHLAPGVEAGALDGLQDERERCLVGLEARGESTLIANRRRQSTGGEQPPQRVEHLGAVAQRLTEARCADGEDHELLDVEAVVGVGTTIDDVHHRHGHQRLAVAARELRQITVERNACIGRGSARGGERHAEDRVGAEARLVLAAVELDHAAIDRRLRARILADEGGLQHRIDVRDGSQHALAAIACLVAIAQLDRLARSGRGAGWHGGATERAGIE
jgi:hypothetical protein